MSLALLGYALVLMSLACAGAGAVVAFVAGRTGSAEGWAWTRRLTWGFGLAMIAATVVMEVALLTHDFSVKYVAQVGSLDTPTHITFVSLWSSLEGSILFWGFVLAVYILAALVLNGKKNTDSMPYAVGTWLVAATFFGLLLAGPANPFWPMPSPVPTDGPGPNALLQNHWLMIAHPPALYLGYVGMTLPFGIAVAALMRGTLGPGQQALLRNALLIPWGFQTLGIVLGGWWAYEVLGWGGYWAWDPVENASLLPWLTATAALHALMLPARRGAMKGWTTTLILATFILTLLGTFMTRSGVFNSVHSFSQSDIGPTFLAAIAATLVFSVVLLALRVDRIEGEGRLGAAVSRESAFLVNNLLFVALTFTVLVGTVFPLLAEAIKGVKVSVGEPYFDRMAVPMGVAILWLMGIGPALPWGASEPDRLRRALLPPVGGGVALLALGAALGARDPWPLVTLFCAGFTTWVSVKAMVEPFVGATDAGDAWRRNRRRIGGYVVHLGIIVIIVAISISSSYRVDQEIRMTTGQTVAFAGYDLTFVEAAVDRDPHRVRQVAVIEYARDGKVLGRLEPSLNQYPSMMQPIGSPDVRTTLTHDLYLSVMSIDTTVGTAGIHAYRNPMVGWLWIGTGVALLGTFLSAWPARRFAVAAAPAVEALPQAGK